MIRVDRRQFFKASTLAVSVAPTACRQADKVTGRSDEVRFLGGPVRSRSPVYLSDLDKCLPRSALSREGKLFCWRVIDYEAEDFRGVMLRAGPETAASEVTYPLEVCGWYDIYLGMFNTAWRPYRGQRVWVKLKSDPAYSLLHLPKPNIDKGQVVQDVFWKTADLSDETISFKQLSLELSPTEEHCKSTCETVWIAYIELVPLTDEEVSAIQAYRRRTDTKRLIATQDVGTGMVVDATAGSVRDLLESYRHTDFGRIYWEGAAGDLGSYFTKIGRMWTRDQIQIEDFPLLEYRRMVENWTQYRKKNIDPFKIAVDFAHEMGLEFHASYRFAEGMGPFHFSPPFDEINKGGFYERHPELRAQRRDGSKAPRISLTFPETRRFLLSLFREMAQYPIDGICLLYNRRPPFVEYETPLVESFEAKYGEDPRNLEEKDPRWLRHRCTILTDFMRQLRQELDEVARERKVAKPLAISAWVLGREEENIYYGMDVRTWIKEGLMDTVIPYTSAPELFSWAPAWEDRQDVDYWLSVTRGTTCQLALNIMPRALSPEQYRRKAHTLYSLGVDHLAFWDSGKVWGIEHDAHSAYHSPNIDGTSLPALHRLGHREEVAAWVESGEPDLVLPTTRLRKVGDWEMTFIAE